MITLSQIDSIVNKFHALNISNYIATYLDGKLYNMSYEDRAHDRMIDISSVKDNYNIKIRENKKRGLLFTINKMNQNNPLNLLNLSKILSYQDPFPRVYKGTDNSTLGNKFIVNKNISGMNIDFEFDSKNKVYNFTTDRMEVVCDKSPMEEHQIFSNGYYFKDFNKGTASCYNKSKNKYIEFNSFFSTNNPDVNFRDLPESIVIDDKVYNIKYDKKFGIVNYMDSDLFYSEINTKSALSIYPILYDPFNLWNNLLISNRINSALYKLFAIAWITDVNNSTVVSVDQYLLDPISVNEFCREIDKLKKK